MNCDETKELQRRIEMNRQAIKATTLHLMEAMADCDADFSLRHISDLKSQLGGLESMIKQAKAAKVTNLTLYNFEW